MMRTHGFAKAQSNKGLSPEQIRANKIATTKARGESRRTARKQAADVMTNLWRKLSPPEQLRELDSRPGLCQKQVAKILRKLNDDDLAVYHKKYKKLGLNELVCHRLEVIEAEYQQRK